MLFCVILYKSKLKALTTLQKRAMQIVLKTSRQSHTRPIFYKLKTLHFDDIVNSNIAAFMHTPLYKELPQIIQRKFLLNNTIHKYGTRSEKNFMINLCKPKRKSFSIIFKGPKHWNKFPADLKQCVNARTFKAILYIYIYTYIYIYMQIYIHTYTYMTNVV